MELLEQGRTAFPVSPLITEADELAARRSLRAHRDHARAAVPARELAQPGLDGRRTLPPAQLGGHPH